jgi:flagellar biosynthesis/type III secretory pathway M-ring protein FliF/YscJ
MENSTIIWIVVAIVVVLIIIGVIAYMANRSSDDKRQAGTRGRQQVRGSAESRGDQPRGTTGSRGDETRGQEVPGQSRDRTTTSRPAGKASDGPTRSRRGKRR